uniref:RNA-binding protein 39-like n=1 Tax=Rhizophora mucronata TaxID=61149 RepID=A0A2P2LEI1_RHIMU
MVRHLYSVVKKMLMPYRNFCFFLIHCWEPILRGKNVLSFEGAKHCDASWHVFQLNLFVICIFL